MRLLILPLVALAALAPQGAQQGSRAVASDTGRDSALVWLDGHLVQRDRSNLPDCPMPVARGNSAVPIPNFAPPRSIPAPRRDTLTLLPKGDSARAEILRGLVEQSRRQQVSASDPMPVERSGCRNPLFEEGRGRRR